MHIEENETVLMFALLIESSVILSVILVAVLGITWNPWL